MTNEMIKETGHYLDLDKTLMVMHIAKKEDIYVFADSWTDYSYEDGEGWDEEQFYTDFNAWWDALSDDTRRDLYNRVCLDDVCTPKIKAAIDNLSNVAKWYVTNILSNLGAERLQHLPRGRVRCRGLHL